jgi:hypothetical protein
VSGNQFETIDHIVGILGADTQRLTVLCTSLMYPTMQLPQQLDMARHLCNLGLIDKVFEVTIAGSRVPPFYTVYSHLEADCIQSCIQQYLDVVFLGILGNYLDRILEDYLENFRLMHGSVEIQPGQRTIEDSPFLVQLTVVPIGHHGVFAPRLHGRAYSSDEDGDGPARFHLEPKVWNSACQLCQDADETKWTTDDTRLHRYFWFFHQLIESFRDQHPENKDVLQDVLVTRNKKAKQQTRGDESWVLNGFVVKMKDATIATMDESIAKLKPCDDLPSAELTT